MRQADHYIPVWLGQFWNRGILSLLFEFRHPRAIKHRFFWNGRFWKLFKVPFSFFLENSMFITFVYLHDIKMPVSDVWMLEIFYHSMKVVGPFIPLELMHFGQSAFIKIISKNSFIDSFSSFLSFFIPFILLFNIRALIHSPNFCGHIFAHFPRFDGLYVFLWFCCQNA